MGGKVPPRQGAIVVPVDERASSLRMTRLARPARGIILGGCTGSSPRPTTCDARAGRVLVMRTWTATTTTAARPAEVLDVLTDPDAASRWAPVAFELEELTRPPPPGRHPGARQRPVRRPQRRLRRRGRRGRRARADARRRRSRRLRRRLRAGADRRRLRGPRVRVRPSLPRPRRPPAGRGHRRAAERRRPRHHDLPHRPRGRRVLLTPMNGEPDHDRHRGARRGPRRRRDRPDPLLRRRETPPSRPCAAYRSRCRAASSPP